MWFLLEESNLRGNCNSRAIYRILTSESLIVFIEFLSHYFHLQIFFLQDRSGKEYLSHKLIKRFMNGSHTMQWSWHRKAADVLSHVTSKKSSVMVSPLSRICLFCPCLFSVQRRMLIRLVICYHVVLKVYPCSWMVALKMLAHCSSHLRGEGCGWEPLKSYCPWYTTDGASVLLSEFDCNFCQTVSLHVMHLQIEIQGNPFNTVKLSNNWSGY